MAPRKNKNPSVPATKKSSRLREAVERRQLLKDLREAEGKDVAQLQAVREKFTARLLKDVDKLYEHLWFLLESANGKEDDPKVRLMMKIMDKVLSDRHEKIAPSSTRQTAVVFNVQGVDRGTQRPLQRPVTETIELEV